MTTSENERLATLEADVKGVREDVSEIKGIIVNQNLQARIAVLEDRSARMERLLYVSGTTGGLAVLGHVPTVLQALGG